MASLKHVDQALLLGYIKTHPFLGTKVKACSERNLQLILNSICLDRAILLLTTYAFNQARSPHNFGFGPRFRMSFGSFSPFRLLSERRVNLRPLLRHPRIVKSQGSSDFS